MVYVVANDGQPLMPTERHGKVCRMLKSGMAKVVKKCPFTIQLQYESERNVQPVSLGVDAGSKHIGISATTKTKVLYESDVELRDDIVKLLATRRQLRRSRRSRKTRYRPVRFDNRKRKEGWLAPSIRQKIGSHLTVVANACKILPINQIIVETASFDIQKIKDPEIQGIEYQQGEQMDFWNIREYVLFRDGHICQCCKGRSKDKILNVHHIESRKTGGNAPNNLITLCETCHNRQIHKQTILKGGIRKSNQAEYLVKGYRLFDKVRYQGREYFIFGRRKSGFFDIRTLSGEKVNKGSISVKKLTFADTRKNYLIERRTV